MTDEVTMLRQALMHRDASNRALQAQLQGQAIDIKIAKDNAKMWKRQSGYQLFGTLGVGLAAFVLWLLLQEKERQLEKAQQTCEQVARNPNVMELPPTEIVVPRDSPTIEL